MFCSIETPQPSPAYLPHRQRTRTQVEPRITDLGITYENYTPHQPQENSIAEDINQTLMNAASANLHHANHPETYWEDAVRDTEYKYNTIPHRVTGQAPHTLWHTIQAQPKQLLIFGQLGTIPVYGTKKKLDTRSRTVRYVFQ